MKQRANRYGISRVFEWASRDSWILQFVIDKWWKNFSALESIKCEKRIFIFSHHSNWIDAIFYSKWKDRELPLYYILYRVMLSSGDRRDCVALTFPMLNVFRILFLLQHQNMKFSLVCSHKNIFGLSSDNFSYNIAEGPQSEKWQVLLINKKVQFDSHHILEVDDTVKLISIDRHTRFLNWESSKVLINFH